MRNSKTYFSFLCIALIAAACSSEGDEDSGADRGGTQPRDATAPRDAIVAPDALVDGGIEAEAGPPADTGEPDLGVEVHLVSLAITPAPVVLEEAATQALSVTGTYSDGSNAPVVDGVTFTSSNDAVASVSAEGIVTALTVGTASVTAAVGAIEAHVDVTVLATVRTVRVFTDYYEPGVSFIPFGGATNDVQFDADNPHSGSVSLRIEVPAAGYTGGAMATQALLDLSSFDALVFWGRASSDLTMNVAGISNDATDALYQTERGVALTGTWAEFAIPIPNPAALIAENGLFHFAEGAEDGPYTIWLDDIHYANLGSALQNRRPAIPALTRSLEIGGSFDVAGTSETVEVSGVDVTSNVNPANFTFISSDTTVATVVGNRISGIATGAATITAELNGVPAAGTISVNVAAPTFPPAAAPTPATPSADVLSLFSNAYTNLMVDTWSAPWDVADYVDITIAGDDTKQYSNMMYAGIEFIAQTVDASAMTHFHIDIWTPDSTVFRVKLVDFGPNNVYDGGGDDTEHELSFDATTTPALATSQWISFDLPFTDFVNLAGRNHLAQLVVSGSNSSVFIDNVYFHR